MPPPSEDEFHTSAMVDAVREMTRELQEHTRHADAERERLMLTVNSTVAGALQRVDSTVDGLRGDVQGTVESMRKDVHKAILNLQLDASQHRDEHIADRKERAADAVARLNRQLTQNLWMGVLTALVVINLLLLALIVVRVLSVWFG